MPFPSFPLCHICTPCSPLPIFSIPCHFCHIGARIVLFFLFLAAFAMHLLFFLSVTVYMLINSPPMPWITCIDKLVWKSNKEHQQKINKHQGKGTTWNDIGARKIRKTWIMVKAGMMEWPTNITLTDLLNGIWIKGRKGDLNLDGWKKDGKNIRRKPISKYGDIWRPLGSHAVMQHFKPCTSLTTLTKAQLQTSSPGRRSCLAWSSPLV